MVGYSEKKIRVTWKSLDMVRIGIFPRQETKSSQIFKYEEELDRLKWLVRECVG